MTTLSLSFERQQKAYQKQINDDLAEYVRYLRSSSKQYGSGSMTVTDAFCDLLLNGGKRLRGTMTLVGYELCGGTHQAMITQAARSMEMIHAALLLIDDVQDRSPRRHGQPAAYVSLGQNYHDEQLGQALAINAGLMGLSAAQAILANLDAPAELRANVLSITNRTLLVTAHGQIADQLSRQQVAADQVANWKTAQYSVLNPLHIGMVLAGAGCEDTDAITPFALELGQAWQLVNDLEGVFGDPAKTGKDPLDDIREGKRTSLVEHALKHTSAADRQFLDKALGNQQLTATDFKRCQQIIRASGAPEAVQTMIAKHCRQALKSLQSVHLNWPTSEVNFLMQLVDGLNR